MRRLYISDSKSSRTVRPAAVMVICAVILLLFIDWAVFGVVKTISSEPPEIVSGLQNAPGVDALWRFNDDKLFPVVFTGSSQMQTALSPYLFDDDVRTLSGRSVVSVNVSFAGADTVITQHIIQKLLIPMGIKNIIYGIEMRALNVPARYYETAFEDSPLGYVLLMQPGPEQTTLLWLLRHSSLVRYRNNIRDWLSGARVMDEPGYKADDRGHVALGGKYDGNLTFIQSQFTPFAASEQLQSSLQEIANNCRANTVRCVLVNMPVHEDAYQYITPQDEASYRTILDKVITQNRIPFWDLNTQACRALLGSESFQDSNHLNVTGARRFTAALAALYVREEMGSSSAGNSEPDLVSCGRIFEP